MRLLQLYEAVKHISELTHEELVTAITTVRDQYLSDGTATCQHDFGNGLCDNVLSDVYEILKDQGYSNVYHEEGNDFFAIWGDQLTVGGEGIDADLNLIDQHWGGIPQGYSEEMMNYIMSNASHTWIVFNKRHYDADAPQGVDHFLQLPFFVGWANIYKKKLLTVKGNH